MKKWIILSERADVAGEVRFPEERSIAVPIAEANELIGAGKAKSSDAPGGEASTRKAPAKAKPVAKRKAKAKPPVAAAPPTSAEPAVHAPDEPEPSATE